MNRGNGRQRLFHTPADYDAFLRVLAEALERVPGVALLAYCLMPNHWHLVLRPARAGDLARFMSWLCVTHVRRHHRAHRTRGGGHLYQGRYKSLPVQDDEHLLILLRYVEANALRARLVERAQRWRWCSLWRGTGRKDKNAPPTLAASPVPRPGNWLTRVNAPMEGDELKRLRESVRRGRPFGDDDWIVRTAKRLGLTFTLRNPGRPKKAKKSESERK